MNRQRRRILITLSLLPAGGGASSTSAVGRLLDLCDDPVAAARLGAVYLKQWPSTPTATLDALIDRLDIDDSLLPALSERTLRERVSATVCKDFASGHTATVRGWLLSRTELELCALHCLFDARH